MAPECIDAEGHSHRPAQPPPAQDGQATGPSGPAPAGTAPAAALRVLVADDHTLLRSGLRLLLEKAENIQVVGEAATRQEALAQVRALQPDIVILDIHLEDGSSLDLICAIKESSPRSKILVLTMYDDEGYLRQALAAGCDGYVLKKAADAELLTAITAVSQGKAYVDPSLTRYLVKQALHHSPAQTIRGPKGSEEAPLSEREKEVLRLVARGLSNQEIAATLFISIKTVETHKAHIREKTGLKRRSDLVRYAREHGLG
ncbi:MAG: response regulator transcription factor [Clostridia bacterium]|nr:MAG: response regulator transcription factor [Clostridia bacterium]